MIHQKAFDKLDVDEVLKHYGYKPEEIHCNGIGIGVWRKEEAFQKLGEIGAVVRFIDHNPSVGRPLGEVIPPNQQIDAADQGTIELGSGAIIDLNEGEKVEFADPKHPNTGFDNFSAAIIKQIAAALEIPSEVLMKQFTASYSAARGALNEFWRTCDMMRSWFVDDFCQPIYEEWLTEAVASGRVSAPGFFDDPAIRKAYTSCTWNGPARTNLNPVQEVDAAVKRVDAGFSTADQETATMNGGSYAMNIRQRVIEAKMKKEVDDIAKEGNIPNRESGGNTADQNRK